MQAYARRLSICELVGQIVWKPKSVKQIAKRLGISSAKIIDRSRRGFSALFVEASAAVSQSRSQDGGSIVFVKVQRPRHTGRLQRLQRATAEGAAEYRTTGQWDLCTLRSAV